MQKNVLHLNHRFKGPQPSSTLVGAIKKVEWNYFQNYSVRLRAHFRNSCQLPVQALQSRFVTRSFPSSKMADEGKNKRFRNEPRSTLSCYALRLKPGQEVRECLLKYVMDKKLKAPFVLSCVGSVTQATLRLANAAKDTPNEVRKYFHLSCLRSSW